MNAVFLGDFANFQLQRFFSDIIWTVFVTVKFCQKAKILKFKCLTVCKFLVIVYL